MKRILEYPRIYNFYQRLIGSRPYLKRFKSRFLKIEDGMKILDMGCGTSNILEFINEDVKYYGVDCSQKYIDYSSKNFTKHRFVCQSICKKLDIDEKFDVVISKGVLAALSDVQLCKMFEVIVSLSNQNTKIILSDMNYKTDACWLQKFLQRNERNKNLRSKEDYIKIISKYFDIDNITELDNIYRIPYSRIVFECHIKN